MIHDTNHSSKKQWPQITILLQRSLPLGHRKVLKIQSLSTPLI